MAKTDNEKRKVITTPFVANFVNVFKAKPYEDGEPEYSLLATFPPNDVGLKALRVARNNAMIEKFGPKDEWPAKWHDPIMDGDDKPEWEGFPGTIYVKFASKKHKPGLIDQNREDIIDEDEFYSGCIARAHVVAYAWEKKGKKGVSFQLENIQLIKKKKRLSGKPSAQSVFDAVEVDEDEDDYSTEDEDDDTPPPKKKKKAPEPEDDEDEAPKKKKKRPVEDDEDEDDTPPPKKKKAETGKKKKRPAEDDDDDELW